MDWQSAIAVAAAIGCGLWYAWQVARPFSGRPTPCAGCTFCGADGRTPARSELLQIEPCEAGPATEGCQMTQ
ncbi:MAG: hypothetical protein ABIL09_19850 [Gemmatimonadota bacterium]